MIPYIIPYLLIIIAAICSALMDSTGDIVEFNRSIFRYANDKFWCKEVSWQYAKKIFGWKADAWHIAKSIMIICFAFAMAFFKSTGHWYIDVALIGLAWNISFSLFYNKIFKK